MAGLAEARSGSDPTVASDFVRAFGETGGFLLGRPVRPKITRDGAFVLFLRGEARSARLDLFEFDTATGTTRCLARAGDLLGAESDMPSEAEKARRERRRITDSGIVGFDVDATGKHVLVPLGERTLLLDRLSGTVRALLPPSMPGALDARFSPDGARVAFAFERDLWIVPVAGGPPRRLSPGGDAQRFFGLPEFVAQEEMGRFSGYWFSPDGVSIAFTEVDERDVETFAIADPARPERAPAAFRYPRAGRANARVRLALSSVDGGDPTWVRWDQDRYPYLARFLWQSVHAPPALLVQSRDQREAVLLSVDVRTGATRSVLAESDPAWLNLDASLPRVLPDGSGFLHVSERADARVLERRSWDGAVERVVVPPSDGFLSLVSVDPRSQSALVLCGDALHTRLVRVGLGAPAGSPHTLFDDGGEHTVLASGSGEVLVDTVTRAERLTFTRVLRLDGAPPTEIPSVAAEPPFLPRLEYVQVGDLALNAVLIRPRAFDATVRYPVVLHVYGGPHSLMVRADARHYLLDQWIADQGAIVVAIDNRGTPRRGRAFERAIKGSFADIPLADQIAGLRALGARFPELDLARVGVYGWSFGGYLAALAVLRRPDVFKVAVAGAPVVDWADYDTHYTERYLDLPEANPSGYRDSNLLTHAGALAAAALSRPLLLVHGTADDNVYFLHSMKLADALLRAGRPFDFLPLPGATHQLGDVDLRCEVWRRTADYLLRHL